MTGQNNDQDRSNNILTYIGRIHELQNDDAVTDTQLNLISSLLYSYLTQILGN